MQIEIDGKKYPLERNNTVIARNAVNSFVDVMRRSAISTNNDALYLTTLLMMLKKSSELLDEFGEENLLYVLQNHQKVVAKYRKETEVQ